MRFEERKFLPKDGKCGFIETGRRHNALKFDGGSFHDELLMCKDL